METRRKLCAYAEEWQQVFMNELAAELCSPRLSLETFHFMINWSDHPDGKKVSVEKWSFKNHPQVWRFLINFWSFKLQVEKLKFKKTLNYKLTKLDLLHNFDHLKLSQHTKKAFLTNTHAIFRTGKVRKTKSTISHWKIIKIIYLL